MTTINKAPENLEEALIDVETRFLYSLPESELTKTDRLFFQIEQAYWYYEDFKADRFQHLPHFASLKSFAKKIFEHCDLLKDKSNQFPELFGNFASYKAKIPVCGCILLNPSMNKIVLVCNWDGKSWSFPRGKIDEKETEFDCAMREVQEETGYNPKAHCNENDYLICFQEQKKIQLFIGTNVPEDTVFQSKTRKEISRIEFFDMNHLPKSTFLVHPFIPKLRRWIEKKQKVLIKPSSTKQQHQQLQPGQLTILKKGSGGLLSTPNRKNKNHNNNNNNNGNTGIDRGENPSQRLLKRRNQSLAIDAKNIDTFSLFPSGGGSMNAEEEPSDYLENMNSDRYRWSVEEMFKANAKITGKEYDYDGNPHSFGSSHPKFVNYRNYNDLLRHQPTQKRVGTQKLSTSSTSATMNDSVGNNNDHHDLDFATLSLQSQQLGEKFLRGRNHPSSQSVGMIMAASKSFDEKEFENFRISESLGKPAVHQKPTFFVLPFQLNKKDIMEAMDEVLAKAVVDW